MNDTTYFMTEMTQEEFDEVVKEKEMLRYAFNKIIEHITDCQCETGLSYHPENTNTIGWKSLQSAYDECDGSTKN